MGMMSQFEECLARLLPLDRETVAYLFYLVELAASRCCRPETARYPQASDSPMSRRTTAQASSSASPGSKPLWNAPVRSSPKRTGTPQTPRTRPGSAQLRSGLTTDGAPQPAGASTVVSEEEFVRLFTDARLSSSSGG